MARLLAIPHNVLLWVGDVGRQLCLLQWIQWRHVQMLLLVRHLLHLGDGGRLGGDRVAHVGLITFVVLERVTCVHIR